MKNRFEELIDAARDAAKEGKLPHSFYCNEDNHAVFIVKHDRFGRDLLLEVFADEDGFWFRGRNYHEAAFAVNAAKRRIGVEENFF